MKRIAILVVVALSIAACTNEQAKKEQQEREHNQKISKAVKMPM